MIGVNHKRLKLGVFLLALAILMFSAGSENLTFENISLANDTIVIDNLTIIDNSSFIENTGEQVIVENLTNSSEDVVIPENITVEIVEVTSNATENNTFNASGVIVEEIVNFTESDVQVNASLYAPVKWKRTIRLERKSNTTIKTRIHKNARVKNVEEKDSDDVDFEKTENFRERRRSKEVEVEITANNSDEIVLEYETPAPEVRISDVTLNSRKIVINSSFHYVNISSYMDIPNTPFDSVKLYWIVNGVKTEFTGFTLKDNDGDSLADRIEWITPHLSEQIFIVELNVLNVQSYPVLYGEWEILFATTGTADLVITPVNTTLGEYDGAFDLRLLKVYCGNAEIAPQIVKNSEEIMQIAIPAYSCSENSKLIVKELSTGVHHFKFLFGNLEAFAHNYATSATKYIGRDVIGLEGYSFRYLTTDAITNLSINITGTGYSTAIVCSETDNVWTCPWSGYSLGSYNISAISLPADNVNTSITVITPSLLALIYSSAGRSYVGGSMNGTYEAIEVFLDGTQLTRTYSPIFNDTFFNLTVDDRTTNKSLVFKYNSTTGVKTQNYTIHSSYINPSDGVDWNEAESLSIAGCQNVQAGCSSETCVKICDGNNPGSINLTLGSNPGNNYLWIHASVEEAGANLQNYQLSYYNGTGWSAQVNIPVGTGASNDNSSVMTWQNISVTDAEKINIYFNPGPGGFLFIEAVALSNSSSYNPGIHGIYNPDSFEVNVNSTGGIYQNGNFGSILLGTVSDYASTFRFIDVRVSDFISNGSGGYDYELNISSGSHTINVTGWYGDSFDKESIIINDGVIFDTIVTDSHGQTDLVVMPLENISFNIGAVVLGANISSVNITFNGTNYTTTYSNYKYLRNNFASPPVAGDYNITYNIFTNGVLNRTKTETLHVRTLNSSSFGYIPKVIAGKNFYANGSLSDGFDNNYLGTVSINGQNHISADNVLLEYSEDSVNWYPAVSGTPYTNVKFRVSLTGNGSSTPYVERIDLGNGVVIDFNDTTNYTLTNATVRKGQAYLTETMNGELSYGNVLNMKLDKESGETDLPLDYSGQENNAVLNGGATWVPSGKSGGAYAFDGTTDYLEFSNSDSLKLTNGTISAWVRTSNAGTSWRSILAKKFAYGMFVGGIPCADNEPSYYDWLGNTQYCSGVSIADNNWHMISQTFQSGVVNGTTIYVDGVAVKTGNMTIELDTFTPKIGKNLDTEYFKGVIDEARIWNRTLTSAEIYSMYATHSISKTGVITTNGVYNATNVSLVAYNYGSKSYTLMNSSQSTGNQYYNLTLNSSYGLEANFTNIPYFAETDFSGPTVYNYYPSTTAPIRYSSITVQSDFSDDTGLKNATLYINNGSGYYAHSSVNLSGNYDTAVYSFDTSSLARDTIVYYKIYAYDNLSNPYTSTPEKSFIVMSPYQLAFEMFWSSLLDINDNIFNGTFTQVNASIIVDIQYPNMVSVINETTLNEVNYDRNASTLQLDYRTKYIYDNLSKGTFDGTRYYNGTVGMEYYNGMLYYIAFDNTTNALNVLNGSLVSGTFTPGFGYRQAKVSDESGVMITQKDDIRYERGTPLAESDLMGQAGVFDGVEDYIPTPLDSANLGNFTVSVWAKTYTSSTDSFSTIMGDMDYTGTTVRGWGIRSPGTYGATHSIFIGNSTTLQQINLGDIRNRWVNIVIVYNGTQQQSYLNGQLVGTVDFPFEQSPSNISLGRTPNLNWADSVYNGSIDEVRIWNRTLTASEILQNYESPYATPNTTGMVMWYDFDNTTNTTHLVDKSGAGNHGIISGMTRTNSTIISPRIYEHFDPHQGTIRAWVKPNFYSNDSIDHYIYRIDTHSPWSYLIISKYSNNKIRVTVNDGNSVGYTSGYSQTLNWTPGEWHYFSVSWDLNTYLNSTNHFRIVVDNVTTYVLPENLTYTGAFDSQMGFGDFWQGDIPVAQFDGVIAGFQMENRVWNESEVTADYNNGAGKNTVVTPYTKMYVPAQDSTDLVWWDWKDYNATNTNGNHIKDGMMENKGTGNWSLIGTATMSKSTNSLSGTQSMALESNNNQYDYAYQTMSNLIEGKDYVFVSDFMMTNNSNGSVTPGPYIVKGSTALRFGWTTNNSLWKHFETVFDLNSSQLSPTVNLYVTRAVINYIKIYYDNVGIWESKSYGGGFERDFNSDGVGNNWTAYGGVDATLNASIYHTTEPSNLIGSSQKLTNANASRYVMQSVAVTQNKWYALGAWAYVSTGNASIILSDATTKTINLSGASWNKYGYTFKAGSSQLNISLSGGPIGNGTAYFDDIYLVELDNETANTSTPSNLTNSFNVGRRDANDSSILVDGEDTLYYANIIPSDEGSVSIWFKPLWNNNTFNNGKHEIIFRLTGSPGYIYVYKDGWSPRIYLTNYNGSTYFGVAAMNNVTSDFNTRWHNIIVTWSSSQQKTCLSLDSNTSCMSGSNLNFVSSGYIRFYSWIPSNQKNPDLYLSEMQVYDHPLADWEVSDLYNNGLYRHGGAYISAPILLNDTNSALQNITVSVSGTSPYTTLLQTRHSSDNLTWTNWTPATYTRSFITNNTLFYESFDNGFTADYSKGSATALSTNNATLTSTGKINNGTDIYGGSLQYNKTSNVNASQGTIEFWIKPDMQNNTVYGLFDTGYGVSAYLGLPLDEGLVGYWRMNNSAEDYSGQDNDGINSGSVNFTRACISGDGCYAFDGTAAGRINLGNPTSLNLTNDFTISAWVKPSSTQLGGVTFKEIVSKGGYWDFDGVTGSSYQMGYFNSTKSITILMRYGAEQYNNTLLNSLSINDNEWSYVVTTLNSTGYAKLYINGVYADGESLPAGYNSVLANDRDVWIGGSSTDTANRYFTGSIDEVKIFNRTLSDSEILKLYNAGSFRCNSSSSNSTLIISDNIINNWNHLGYSWDNSSMRIYLNGELAAESDSGCVPDTASVNNLTFGMADGYYANASFDGIRISNRPLDKYELSYYDGDLRTNYGLTYTHSLVDGANYLQYRLIMHSISNTTPSLLSSIITYTDYNEYENIGYVESEPMYLNKNFTLDKIILNTNQTLNSTDAQIQFREGNLLPNGSIRWDEWSSGAAYNNPGTLLFEDFENVNNLPNALAGYNVTDEEGYVGRGAGIGYRDWANMSEGGSASATREDVGLTFSGGPVTDAFVNDYSNLVAYYSFDNESNFTKDDTGHGYNGNTTNGADYHPSGKLGGAASFDGINDYINLGSSPSLLFNTSFTYSAWINVKGIGSGAEGDLQGIIGGQYSSFRLYYQYQKLIFYSYNSEKILTSSGNPSFGRWHHIVATWNTTNMTFYIDGTYDSSTNYTRTNYSAVGPVYMGSTAGVSEYYFNGLIDEVRIYNKSLSPSEIVSLYKRGRYWKESEFPAALYRDLGVNKSINKVRTYFPNTTSSYYSIYFSSKTSPVSLIPVKLDKKGVIMGQSNGNWRKLEIAVNLSNMTNQASLSENNNYYTSDYDNTTTILSFTNLDAKKYYNYFAFNLSSYNLSKYSSITPLAFAYGKGWNGTSQAYGINLSIWNNKTKSWDYLDWHNNSDIKVLGQILTVNITNYLDNQSLLYLAVYPTYPANTANNVNASTIIDYISLTLTPNQTHIASDWTEVVINKTASGEITDEFTPRQARWIGTVMKNMVPNGDMEDIDLAPNTPDIYSVSSFGGENTTYSITQGHNGEFAYKADIFNATEFIEFNTKPTMTVGKNYTLSTYYKTNRTSVMIMVASGNSQNKSYFDYTSLTNDSFKRFNATFTHNDSAAIYYRHHIVGNSQLNTYLIFDDMRMVEGNLPLGDPEIYRQEVYSTNILSYNGTKYMSNDSGTIEFWGKEGFSDYELDEAYYLIMAGVSTSTQIACLKHVSVASHHCKLRDYLGNQTFAYPNDLGLNAYREKWHHYAIVYDKFQSRTPYTYAVYVDGILNDGITTFVEFNISQISRIDLGHGNNLSQGNMVFDNLHISNYAKTQYELDYYYGRNNSDYAVNPAIVNTGQAKTQADYIQYRIFMKTYNVTQTPKIYSIVFNMKDTTNANVSCGSMCYKYNYTWNIPSKAPTGSYNITVTGVGDTENASVTRTMTLIRNIIPTITTPESGVHIKNNPIDIIITAIDNYNVPVAHPSVNISIFRQSYASAKFQANYTWNTTTMQVPLGTNITFHNNLGGAINFSSDFFNSQASANSNTTVNFDYAGVHQVRVVGQAPVLTINVTTDNEIYCGSYATTQTGGITCAVDTSSVETLTPYNFKVHITKPNHNEYYNIFHSHFTFESMGGDLTITPKAESINDTADYTFNTTINVTNTGATALKNTILKVAYFDSGVFDYITPSNVSCGNISIGAACSKNFTIKIKDGTTPSESGYAIGWQLLYEDNVAGQHASLITDQNIIIKEKPIISTNTTSITISTPHNTLIRQSYILNSTGNIDVTAITITHDLSLNITTSTYLPNSPYLYKNSPGYFNLTINLPYNQYAKSYTGIINISADSTGSLGRISTLIPVNITVQENHNYTLTPISVDVDHQYNTQALIQTFNISNNGNINETFNITYAYYSASGIPFVQFLNTTLSPANNSNITIPSGSTGQISLTHSPITPRPSDFYLNMTIGANKSVIAVHIKDMAPILSFWKNIDPTSNPLSTPAELNTQLTTYFNISDEALGSLNATYCNFTLNGATTQVTASRQGLTETFICAYTPTQEGTLAIKMFARDATLQEANISTSISVTGATNTSANATSIVQAYNIGQYQPETLSVGITINNIGYAKATNVYVNSTSYNISMSPVNISKAGTASTTFNLTIPQDSNPGAYPIPLTIYWTNLNGSTQSRTITNITANVYSNPIIGFEGFPTTIDMQHGEERNYSVNITSVGNADLQDISITLGQTTQYNLTLSQTYISVISRGSKEPAILTVNAKPGEQGTAIKTSINFTSNDDQKTVNITVNIPENITYTAPSNITIVEALSYNSTKIITIENTGNANKQFYFSIINISNMTVNSSISIPKLTQANATIAYMTPGIVTTQTGYINLSYTNSTGQRVVSLIPLSLTTIPGSLNISSVSHTIIDRLSDTTFYLTANFSVNYQTITNNTDFTISFDGYSCPVFSQIYTTEWQVSCTIPSSITDGMNHTLKVEAYSQDEGVTFKDESVKVFFKDMTPPTIINTLTGVEQDFVALEIGVEASDNINITRAEVFIPSTNETIALTRTGDWYKTQVIESALGDYLATFSISDDNNNTVIANTTFGIYRKKTFTGTLKDYLNSPFVTKFAFYDNITGNWTNFTTNADGLYSKNMYAKPYRAIIETQKYTITFDNIPLQNATTNFIQFDKVPKNLVPLTIAVSGSEAFVIKTNLTTTGSIKINYSYLTLQNEAYLEVFKCDNWNGASYTCASGWWSQLPKTRDIVNKIITATVSDYAPSGSQATIYALVENVPAPTPIVEIPDTSPDYIVNTSTTANLSLSINSAGEQSLSNVHMTCTGTICTSLGFVSGTVQSANPLTPNILIPFTVTIPKGYPAGNYSLQVTVESNAESKNAVLNIEVPVNNKLQISPTTSLQLKTGTLLTNTLTNLSIENLGNIDTPISFSATHSFITKGDASTVHVLEEISLPITITAPEAIGVYAGNITINGQVINYTINVSSNLTITTISPNSSLLPMDNIRVEFETYKNGVFQNESTLDNSTINITVDGKTCAITSVTFTTHFIARCDTPTVMEDKPNYTITVKTSNAADSSAVQYQDVFGPTILNYNSSIEKVENTTRINFTLYDTSGITSISMDVYDKNGTVTTINAMTNDTGTNETNIIVNLGNNTYQLIVNMTSLGDYTLNLTLQDNIGYVSSYSKTFELFRYANFVGEIKDDTGSYVPAFFKFYNPTTSELVESFYHSGVYNSTTLHERPYNLQITALDTDITLNSLDISNITHLMDMRELDLSKVGVTYTEGTTRDIYGIGVDSNITNSGAIVFTYSPTNSSVTNTQNVYIYRCADFDFDNSICNGDFTQLTTARVSNLDGTQTVSANISGFSAYMVTELIPQGVLVQSVIDGQTPGGGGGGGGLGQDDLDSLLENISETVKYSDLREGVNIDTTDITRELYLGENTTTKIRITNTKTNQTIIRFSLSDEIKDIVMLPRNEISLGKNEEYMLEVGISIPESYNKGLYIGSLVMQTDTEQTKIPIQIRVYESAELTPKLSIQPVSVKISPGYQIKLQMGIEYPRTISGNFSLETEIINIATEERIFFEKENIIIKKSMNLLKEINTTKDTRLGDYLIKVTLKDLEKNIEVKDTKTISIVLPILEQRLLGIKYLHYLYGFLVAIILIGIAASWEQVLKYIESKKKYHVSVNLKELPSPGERTGFLGHVAETSIRTFLELDKMTTHTIIAGATGGGKSVSAQVLIEEALDKGIAVVVFDPTAQWSGFLRKLKTQTMIDKYSEYGMKKDEIKAFNGNIYFIEDPREIIDLKKHMIPGEIHIFITSKLTPAQTDLFVANTVRQVFTEGFDEAQTLRSLMVYDEVHRLLPKFGGSGEGFIQIERACREFRKWGIGVVLVSQVLSDFVGEIKANISTEIQMRTRDEGDLNRLKTKYGEEILQSVVRASVGTGMLENPAYNKGKPYLLSFRPLKHSIERLSDQELEEYNKYNAIVDEYEYQIEQLEDLGYDVFDMKLELKLSQQKIKSGQFNMVDIYIESLKPSFDTAWKKLGKHPKKRVKKLADMTEIKQSIEKAKEERKKHEEKIKLQPKTEEKKAENKPDEQKDADSKSPNANKEDAAAQKLKQVIESLRGKGAKDEKILELLEKKGFPKTIIEKAMKK